MSSKNSLQFQSKTFDELSVHELYNILQVRAEIFVVEQNCAFQDMDDLDQKALHVMGYNESGTLLAYARIFPAGITYKEVSIGRILTKTRGKGFGKELINFCIEKANFLYDNSPIRIAAQCHAISFYQKNGFRPIGKEYIEDGIPHIEMLKI